MRFLSLAPERRYDVLARVVDRNAEQEPRLHERHAHRRRNAARLAPIAFEPVLLELGGDAAGAH